MLKPPAMSEAERLKALSLSREARQLRAQYKLKLSASQMTLTQFLQEADANPILAKMRVSELLQALPGLGKIRAESLMRRCNISPTRRVMGLGKHQRKSLLDSFKEPRSSKAGALLVLSGPGGVGKSTVAQALSKVPGFWVSISATTREPRFNEIDGREYYFYSNEEFDEAIAKNSFLEWAEFAGNRYGTPISAVEEARNKGLHVLLEIELAGAQIVREKAPYAKLIFLEPPSWEELVARLEGRGTDSPERRAARLLLAQEELAAASFFDHIIINDRVEDVLDSLISLASS